MRTVLKCPLCGRQLVESNDIELIHYGTKEYHVKLNTLKCHYCGTSDIATGWGKFYMNDQMETEQQKEKESPEKMIKDGNEEFLNPLWVEQHPLYKALIYSDLKFPKNMTKWRSEWYLKIHKPFFRMVIGGVLYDTGFADLLTTEDWWDDDRVIRTYYYRMPRGDYFSVQIGDGQKDHFRRMNEYEIQAKLGKIAPDTYLMYFPIASTDQSNI